MSPAKVVILDINKKEPIIRTVEDGDELHINVTHNVQYDDITVRVGEKGDFAVATIKDDSTKKDLWNKQVRVATSNMLDTGIFTLKREGITTEFAVSLKLFGKERG
jgi:hypothetical protein